MHQETAATTIRSSATKGCISCVQKCVTPNLYFVRVNLVLTDIISISQGCLFGFWIFFFLPSRGELLCVLNLPFLIAVLITPVFCGAFYFSTLRNAEIGFLNLCVINKICPNQITLSLFKIHMGYCVCMCISLSIYISKDGGKGSMVIYLVLKTPFKLIQ